jgi:spoIIIJ-associated protein
VEWVETTGRTIEDAKDTALDQLGVDENEAEFEIVEEPRVGLFGRVRGEARIRARIRPARPRPKTERRDRGRRRDREARSDGNGRSGERRSRGGGDKSSRSDKADKAEKADRDGPRGGEGRSQERRKRGGSGSGGSGGSGGAGKSRGRGSGAGGASRKPAAAGVQDVEIDANGSAPAAAEGREMTEDDVTVEQQADLTEEFLSGLLVAFGVDGQLDRTAVDDEMIEVRVAGDELGLLIGPKGQTLLAVQDLARTYVQRKATGIHHGRVRIDVGGYRQRRREALQRFTRQVASEVQASGVQKALEPMQAGDRKVVHDEVNLIDGVRTISEGEEPRRRVVIVPD